MRLVSPGMSARWQLAQVRPAVAAEAAPSGPIRSMGAKGSCHTALKERARDWVAADAADAADCRSFSRFAWGGRNNQTDQSDAGSAGIFSPRTNRMLDVRACSNDGPIRRQKHGYILTMDQSGAGSMGIFSQRTNRMPEVRLYSRDGPIRHPVAISRVKTRSRGILQKQEHGTRNVSLQVNAWWGPP
eukprot:1195482-Prorocentrum_minimum.AAC.1